MPNHQLHTTWGTGRIVALGGLYSEFMSTAILQRVGRCLNGVMCLWEREVALAICLSGITATFIIYIGLSWYVMLLFMAMMRTSAGYQTPRAICEVFAVAWRIQHILYI